MSTTLQKLERLARDHAKWTAVANDYKKRGADARCTNIKPDHPLPDNCIEKTYKVWKEGDRTAFGEMELTFEEVWIDAVHEGDVCQSCQDVRRFREKRMEARRRLGAVRSAITRIGNSLIHDGGDI